MSQKRLDIGGGSRRISCRHQWVKTLEEVVNYSSYKNKHIFNQLQQHSPVKKVSIRTQIVMLYCLSYSVANNSLDPWFFPKERVKIWVFFVFFILAVREKCRRKFPATFLCHSYNVAETWNDVSAVTKKWRWKFPATLWLWEENVSGNFQWHFSCEKKNVGGNFQQRYSFKENYTLKTNFR